MRRSWNVENVQDFRMFPGVHHQDFLGSIQLTVEDVETVLTHENSLDTCNTRHMYSYLLDWQWEHVANDGVSRGKQFLHKIGTLKTWRQFDFGFEIFVKSITEKVFIVYFLIHKLPRSIC